MGIIADGCLIAIGGVLGSLFKKRVKMTQMYILAIVVMIISLTEVVANLLAVEGERVHTNHLLVVVACLFIGTLLGEKLRLEDRIKGLSSAEHGRLTNALLAGSLFFGIGGLQITAPIACFIHGDYSQLFLKSAIDFPFALVFGAMYGIGIPLSGLVVLGMQLAIGGTAYLARSFFTTALVAQLCSVGYVILFFTGFNLIFENNKISTVNMLPSILILLLYHGILRI